MRMLLKTYRNFCLAVLAALALLCVSCDSVDDTRIPAAPVNIIFNDVGMWNTYGVGGALDSRTFVKENRVPANFPYTASTYTGFGGVLLVCDYFGNPKAYDLSCPVECKRDVRVYINSDNEAECPECHSRYAVFENEGRPISGTAAQRNFGLKRYSVRNGAGGGKAIVP